jgi:hypothetical protein
MTIEGAAPNASSAKSLGDRKWSVVTSSVDDGGTVTMDGDIVTAFADADGQDVFASVTDTSGTDATVQVLNVSDASAAAGQDVTVIALVE